MKRLVTMLAAVATGFFAFGAATPTLTVPKATFEEYEAETPISNQTEGNLHYWLLEAGADAESAIVKAYETDPEAGNTKYLELETGAQTLYRSIKSHESDVTTPADLTKVGIGDGIFLDAQVKFTPSAEYPTCDEGTKLIVWAQAIEDDESANTATNLCVMAGQFGTSITPTNFTLAVGNDFDYTAWHRLTIRAINEVGKAGDGIVGFTLFLDGTNVAVAAVADDYAEKMGISETDLSPAAAKFFNARQLFLSCCQASDVSAQTLSAMGIQGTGSIDNLGIWDKDQAKQNCQFALGEIQFAVVYDSAAIASFNATLADDRELPEGAIAPYAEGKQIISVDGSVEQIKLAVTLNKGYMFVEEPESWIFATAAEQYEIKTAEIGFMVGETPFAKDDFAGALAAAQDAGVPLELVKGFSIDTDTAVDNMGITVQDDTFIDLKGNNIVFTGSYAANTGIYVAAGEFQIFDSVGGGAITNDATFTLVDVEEDATFVLGEDADDKGATIAGKITNRGTIQLVNGFVSKVNATIPAGWLATGKEATDNGDGFWKIAAQSVGTPVVIVVSANGVTTNEFTSLQAAFDAAKAGDTVELIHDLTVNTMATMENKDLIFNLGGYTLLNDGADKVISITNSTVVITNGTINGVAGDAVENTGASHITIARDTTIVSSSPCIVFPRGAVVDVYGTITQQDNGSVPCIWASAEGCVINIYDGANLSTPGGDIIRHRCNMPAPSDNAAVVNIYGGTFSGGDIIYGYASSGKVNNGKVNIYGGTFTVDRVYNVDASAELTIRPFDGECSTLKFSKLATGLADACAGGYEPVQGTDGWYTIAKTGWDVKFYVGDVVSNAQVVANGEYAQAFAYDTEAIEAWTNAAGVAYTEVAITENTDFFAQLKQSELPIPTEYLPADITDDDAAKLQTKAANLIKNGVDATELKAAAAAAKAGNTLTDAQQNIINSLLLQSDTLVEGAKVKVASIAIVNGKVTITVEGVNCELPATTTTGYLTIKHCETVGGDYKAVERITFTSDGVGTAVELDGSDAAGFYKVEFEWNKPEFEAK